MLQRFDTKAILVTGAGSGIGRAAALRLAAEGAQVAALDINTEGLSETAMLIGAGCACFTCELTDSAQVGMVVDSTAARFGRLDGAFNAAGASGRRWGDGPVGACTDAGWARTLDVNLTSMFYVCRSALPHLLVARGAIVNLASVLGMVGGDADFATHAYAAAKAGIIGMSRAMATYYAPQGLRVNVVAPGLIATPMSQRAQDDPHIQARLATLQPLTGTMGTPEDVAAAVAYFLSEDARFTTGAVLTVDGGWTAG
jgi:NAD(P)-dependent dehydrogenase (short-subunit alcohol dehydrogenase family)